jgi:hypothetical protein
MMVFILQTLIFSPGAPNYLLKSYKTLISAKISPPQPYIYLCIWAGLGILNHVIVAHNKSYTLM